MVEKEREIMEDRERWRERESTIRESITRERLGVESKIEL